jgi:hypothetical protein
MPNLGMELILKQLAKLFLIIYLQEPKQSLSTILKELPIQYSGDRIDNIPDNTVVSCIKLK